MMKIDVREQARKLEEMLENLHTLILECHKPGSEMCTLAELCYVRCVGLSVDLENVISAKDD